MIGPATFDVTDRRAAWHRHRAAGQAILRRWARLDNQLRHAVADRDRAERRVRALKAEMGALLAESARLDKVGP